MARSKTMTIDVSVYYYLTFKMVGISLKKFDDKLKFGEICRAVDEENCSSGIVSIEYGRIEVDQDTAQIRVSKLIELLSEIHEEFSFDKLKIEGHYHHSVEEIMNQIINK